MRLPRLSVNTIFAIMLLLIAAGCIAIIHNVHERRRVAEIKTLEWFVANPDKWKAADSDQQHDIEIMKERLFQLKK